MSKANQVSLIQTLLDSYYTYVAEMGYSRFHVSVFVQYLDAKLRQVLIQDQTFNPVNGSVMLNLSVNALRRINYNGNAFYAAMSRNGVHYDLAIPFHAFAGVYLPIEEVDGKVQNGFYSFPSMDIYLFHKNNPDWVNPIDDIMKKANGVNADNTNDNLQSETIGVSTEDMIAWLELKLNRKDIDPTEAVTLFSEMVTKQDFDVAELLEFINSRASSETVRLLNDNQILRYMSQYFYVEGRSDEDTISLFTDLVDGGVITLMDMEGFIKEESASTVEKEKEEVKPLLDFGPLPGINLNTTPSRYKGPPKLTVIQGGKK